MVMIFFVESLTDEKAFSLISSRDLETFVWDPHHRESPTRREQDLNLRKTWIQAWLNEVVEWW